MPNKMTVINIYTVILCVLPKWKCKTAGIHLQVADTRRYVTYLTLHDSFIFIFVTTSIPLPYLLFQTACICTTQQVNFCFVAEEQKRWHCCNAIGSSCFLYKQAKNNKINVKLNSAHEELSRHVITTFLRAKVVMYWTCLQSHCVASLFYLINSQLHRIHRVPDK